MSDSGAVPTESQSYHPRHRRSQLVDGQRLACGLGEDGQGRLACEHLVNVLPLTLERTPVDHVNVVLGYGQKEKREGGGRRKSHCIKQSVSQPRVVGTSWDRHMLVHVHT